MSSESNLSKIVSEFKRSRQMGDQQPHLKTHSSVIGAGGLIYDQKNQRLLVVQGQEKWSLPKGHCEIGEKPHETAQREIWEETSLRVALSSASKSRRILKCIYYFVIVNNGMYLELTPLDTNEVINVRWCTYRELFDMSESCNKQLRFVLKRWSDFMDIFAKCSDKLSYPISIVRT